MKRGPILAIGVVVLVLVAGWFFLLRNEAPPPVSLEEAVETATTTTETATTGTTQASDAVDAAGSSGNGIDGTWVVDATNSFAGYRIGEELANIGTIEAVGRTSDVNGSLTATDAIITAAAVEVNMQALESDRSQRDDALQSRGLETDAFPTASFTLTEPIQLSTAPAVGDSIETTANGELTLHGVTNAVAVSLQGQIVEDGRVVVVGSADLTLADFAIEAPTGFAVVSINDVGVFELQLEFART